MKTITNPKLADVQKWLHSIIVDHHRIAECKDLCQINGDTTWSTKYRLSIYSNAYYLRLLEVLEEGYPGVYKILGKRRFQVLVVYYLNQYPSQSYNINEFGKDLPKYLKKNKISYPKGIIDIASFEWAQVESFYAKEYNSKNKISVINDLSKARLQLDPSVKLFESFYDLNKTSLKRRSTKMYFGIYRFDGIVYTYTLDKNEYKILKIIHKKSKIRLQQLSEIIKVRMPRLNPKKLQTWFETWTRREIIRIAN